MKLKFIKKRMAAVLFMAMAVCIILSGCSFARIAGLGKGNSSFRYKNADKYSVGGAEIAERITKLDIEWVSGKVEIVRHAGDAVVFSEKANKELNEEFSLHYWLDGTTLRIKFAKSGSWDFSDLKKTLTVEIPETLALEDLALDVVSADIETEKITAEKAEIDSVSGGIILGADSLDQLEIEGVSGEIFIEAEQIGELTVDTVSGAVDTAVGKIDVFEADSTSGSVRLSVDVLPEKVRLETISGDVSLYLPENSDFAANIDTVSGEFGSDFAVKKNGDDYICGTGKADLEIETTSGDIDILIK